MKHELGFWFWFYIVMIVNGIMSIIMGIKLSHPFDIVLGMILAITYLFLLCDYKRMD